jgi:hypothetical protein
MADLWYSSGQPSIRSIPSMRRYRFDRLDLPTWADERVAQMISGFRDHVESEFQFDPDFYMGANEQVDFRYWILAGYVQARKRYKDRDFCVLQCFEEIVSKVDRASRQTDYFYVGDRMTVIADIHNVFVKVKVTNDSETRDY